MVLRFADTCDVRKVPIVALKSGHHYTIAHHVCVQRPPLVLWLVGAVSGVVNP